MRLMDEDYRDIQGLVRFGYRHLPSARFHLLTIVDLAAARAWLSEAPVTNAVKGTRPDTALHVALSYEGLRKLGGRPDTLAQFPYEFKSGMTEPSRARRLGDVGANDPSKWQWGGSSNVPDLLVMLYAVTPQRLDEWERQIGNRTWGTAFAPLACLETTDVGDIEPFGFNDGISQPVLDWEDRTPAQHFTTSYTNISALGEVLLGYSNEYGKFTDRPLVAPSDDPDDLLPKAEDAPGKKDLGRNGTYLVFRDLAQDAPAFWQFVNDEAARAREDRHSVAAEIVGRVPAEIPVVSSDTTTGGTISDRAHRGIRSSPSEGTRYQGWDPRPTTFARISSPSTATSTEPPVPTARTSAGRILATPTSRKALEVCSGGCSVSLASGGPIRTTT